MTTSSPSIGDKIKKFRLQLQLSQQQLAGSEMTRAFISMVEQGKARPSLKKLRFIAARLDLPLAVFLETEHGVQDGKELVEVLLRNADLLCQGEQFEGALEALNQAHRFAVQADNIKGQLQSLEKMGLALQQLGRYEEAMDAFEKFIAAAGADQRIEQVVKGYNYLGNIVFSLQQYLMAKRFYNRAIRETGDRKSCMEVRQKCLINKGNCLVRLGEYEGALDAYLEAVGLTEFLGDQRMLALAKLGVGCAYRRLGKLPQAIDATRESLAVLKKMGDPSGVLALHNLATMEGDCGQWESAYPKLEACRAEYHALGWAAQEASILEEFARYWFAQGDLERAIESCRNALKFLGEKDDVLLRGQIHSFLGQLFLAKGETGRAVEHLELAASILRFIGDRYTLSQSLHALDRAHKQFITETSTST